jgi:ClpP class serine protease
VVLAINSPGGSPVQTNLIAKLIREKAEETGIPVYAVVQDVAASGGYWLACAADEIYVDENSLIGSIGVISTELLAAETHESATKLSPGSSKSVEDKAWKQPFRGTDHQDRRIMSKTP